MDKSILTAERQKDLIADAKDIEMDGFNTGFATALRFIEEIAKEGPADVRPLAAYLHILIEEREELVVKNFRDSLYFELDDFRITQNKKDLKQGAHWN